MNNIKQKKWKSQFKQNKLKHFSLFYFLLLSSLSCPFFPMEVTAQNAGTNNSSPPKGQGTPRGTDSAGSRGCQTAAKSMSILTKTEHDSPTTILRSGYTTEAHPTFYVYIPYQPEQIQAAKLSLRTDTGKQIYFMPLDITNSPGVIEVKLPETAPELDLDHWYQVYLFANVLCSPAASPTKDTAIAWIQRQEAAPSVSGFSSNKQASPRPEADFWYDRIAALAKQLTPQYQEQWVNLLKEAGIEEYANEPIVNCCAAKEGQ